MTPFRNHAILLVFALLTVATVGGIYAYMRHIISASIGQAVLAQDAIASQESDKSSVEDTITLYNDTAADRARLSGLFIPADQPLAFIEAVESLGALSSSTLAVSAISADSLEDAPYGAIGTAKAHIDGQGSWPSVMRALMLAEDMPYDTHIGDVRLDAVGFGDPGAKVPEWHIAFDVSISLISSSTQSAGKPKQ